MGRYFYCTLFVTAEGPEALEAAMGDANEAAARQAILDAGPPAGGPAIYRWHTDRVSPCSFCAEATLIDSDASAWTAELAAGHPGVRFDLIQDEGVDIPFPEGIRYEADRQFTGVPLFVPNPSPDWGAVEEGIKAFNPDDPELVDGSWDFLEGPRDGFFPGDLELDGTDADRETFRSLQSGLGADLARVRAAFESADLAVVERATGTAYLALLSPEPSVGRPEVYVVPGGIAEGWQPKDEDLALVVARLLIVGALHRAGMDAPMPI